MKILLWLLLLLAAPAIWAQVNVSGSQIQIGGTAPGVSALTTNRRSGLSNLSGATLNVPAYPSGNVYSAPNFSSLVGAFTDGSGNVIEPVALGDGPTTFFVPSGSTQLQLGINDNDLSDTSGSWVVSVNGTNYTIGAKSAPWMTTGGINSQYPIVVPAATGTVVAAVGAVGTAVTVRYVSGAIANGAICGGSGSGPWDASGQPGCAFDYLPAVPGYWTVAAPLSLTTTGTTGATTLSGGVLNVPVYQGALALTTTGSSGAATLIGNTLNIPNYATGSGLPSCASGQMVYYASSGTTGTCLNVGTNLSIASGTLNASGGGGANLTMNNSGSGAASGTSYNGSAAETISYNTVGAAPALGNCTVETANFTAAATSCYLGNAASGITATLPAISTGAIIRIQNINSGTVTASFGSNFDCTLNGTTTSGTTCAIANGSTGLATTDGTSWYVTVTPTGGGSLPTATAANQPIASTGSGTIYQALTNMSMDGTNISSTGAGACPIVGTGTEICLTAAPYYASPYGATTTTGTTSAANQTTMTVGSCSTFAAHEGVYIAGGGGTAGSTLSWNGTANINTVVSCTGTTMTVNSAIPNQVTNAAVQHDESAAFNAAFAALQPFGGSILLPNITTNQQGTYLVNGPLLDTSGANAILPVPKLPNYSGSNIFGNQMTVEIRGAVDDHNAVPIIESSLGTSGANIIGGYDSAAGGGFPNFTNVALVLRNLLIIGPGGGSETAINGTWILGMQLYRVDVAGGNTTASWSLANGNGVLYPALADEPRVVADTVSIVGFQTCMRMGEHGEVRKLLVSTCTNGLVPDVGPIGAAQLSFANAIHVSDIWCGPQNTSTHNSTVTNCVAAGTEPTAIDIDALSYEGAGTLVNDPSNYLTGRINYSLGLNSLPACPYAPTLSGGANLSLYNLRCPNPTGSGTTAMYNITGSVVASGCTVSSGVCTVGTATNSLTFSSIPSGYNDLIVIVNARASDSANNESLNFQFNGDTGANYDREAVQANGTTSGTTASATSFAAVSAGFAGILVAASAPANVASFLRMEIPFYASTAFYRYVHIHSGSPITLGNGAFYANYDDVSEWKNNSSAISSVKLFDSGGGNINVGSSFVIYGMQ